MFYSLFLLCCIVLSLAWPEFAKSISSLVETALLAAMESRSRLTGYLSPTFVVFFATRPSSYRIAADGVPSVPPRAVARTNQARPWVRHRPAEHEPPASGVVSGLLTKPRSALTQLSQG